MPEMSVEGEDHVAGAGGFCTGCHREHLHQHCIVVRGFGLWTGAEAQVLRFNEYGMAYHPDWYVDTNYVRARRHGAPITLGECARLDNLYWSLGLEWQRNNVFAEYDVGYDNREGNVFLESVVCTDLRWGRERRDYGGRELECEGLDPTA